MPSSVADVLAATGLRPAGAVRWGTPVPLDAPGVYVVALTDDLTSLDGALHDAPIDLGALKRLLAARPELRLDGTRPSAKALAARLRAFWLPDEVVVYIGLAGTSVRKRVRQYYTTPLGARRPHAGGWWLKALTVLDELWVHWAAAADPSDAERRMLGAFADAVSPATRRALHDRDRLAPFANLRTGTRAIKNHGISGATGELTGGKAKPQPPRSLPRRAREGTARESRALHARARRGGLSAVDRQGPEAGRIRFPRSAKRLFPAERTYELVAVRGRELRARWDPRIGPDHERSGLLAFGSGKLDGIVAVDEVLAVRRTGTGPVVLD